MEGREMQFILFSPQLFKQNGNTKKLCNVYISQMSTRIQKELCQIAIMRNELEHCCALQKG